MSTPTTARFPVSALAGGPRNGKSCGLTTFAAGPGVELLIASDGAATASPANRTVEGIIVPFGPAGRTSGGLLTFGAGSLTWSEPRRVKLLVEHDQREAVGFAEQIEERPEGLWARFKVPEGPAGDQVLTEAANGIRDAFSVGVMLDASVEHNLRRNTNGSAVKGTGQLRETSMVSVPAFDDARVGAVAASTRLVVSSWADDTTPEGTPMQFTESQRARLAELLAKSSLSSEETAERDELSALATAAGVTVTAAATPNTAAAASTSAAAAASTTASGSTTSAAANTDRPAVIPAAAGSALTVLSEPSTYAFDGHGSSLVVDAFRARMEGDADAADRVRRFNAELAGGNPTSVAALATAAVETTTTAPDLVPTAQRPDLMRAFIDARRPLISQVTALPISSSAPFAIPSAGEFTGMGDHAEGTAHNAEGSLLFSGDTVTPRAASGAYRVSRELIDASNPLIDRIALRKMVKDYRRYTELKAYTTWANGLVATASIDTVAKLDAQIDGFINDDEETADFVAFSPTFLTTLKGDVDTTGRPHLARYAPVNTTAELTSSRTGVVAVFGDTRAIRASRVATDSALLARAAGLMWAESPVQQFSFSEVEGPGIVKLALWAYTAAAVLEPTDVQLVKSGV